MKPIIGIVGRPTFPDEDLNNALIAVKESYRNVIIKNGGIPIAILPPKQIFYNNAKSSEVSELTEDEKDILMTQLKLCDGILMPGGYKVFSHDFFILDYAISNNIPVLGICLGMQIMSNYKCEYYNERIENNTNHFDISGKVIHDVKIKKDSKLYSIINKEVIGVNSMHNFRATKGGIYDIVATSDDGVIEALELPNAVFNIGVQWHPEVLDNDDSNKLFQVFIKSTLKRKNQI